MRDCGNVEVRDLLPDLLHERLAGDERMRVVSHVDTCADCSDELTLLRTAIVTVTAEAPPVDTRAIAAGVLARLGAERTERSERVMETPMLSLVADDGAWRVVRQARRSLWSMPAMRAAAAAVVMVLGTAVVVRQRGATDGTPNATSAAHAPVVSAPAIRSTPSATAPVAIAPHSAPESTSRATVKHPSSPSALGASFADLTDAELEAVLAAVDGPDALPAAEPAPAPAVVTSGDVL